MSTGSKASPFRNGSKLIRPDAGPHASPPGMDPMPSCPTSELIQSLTERIQAYPTRFRVSYFSFRNGSGPIRSDTGPYLTSSGAHPILSCPDTGPDTIPSEWIRSGTGPHPLSSGTHPLLLRPTAVRLRPVSIRPRTERERISHGDGSGFAECFSIDCGKAWHRPWQGLLTAPAASQTRKNKEKQGSFFSLFFLVSSLFFLVFHCLSLFFTVCHCLGVFLVA